MLVRSLDKLKGRKRTVKGFFRKPFNCPLSPSQTLPLSFIHPYPHKEPLKRIYKHSPIHFVSAVKAKIGPIVGRDMHSMTSARLRGNAAFAPGLAEALPSLSRPTMGKRKRPISSRLYCSGCSLSDNVKVPLAGLSKI